MKMNKRQIMTFGVIVAFIMLAVPFIITSVSEDSSADEVTPITTWGELKTKLEDVNTGSERVLISGNITADKYSLSVNGNYILTAAGAASVNLSALYSVTATNGGRLTCDDNVTLIAGLNDKNNINLAGSYKFCAGSSLEAPAGMKLIGDTTDAMISLTAGEVEINAEEVGGAVIYALNDDAVATYTPKTDLGDFFKSGDIIVIKDGSTLMAADGGMNLVSGVKVIAGISTVDGKTGINITGAYTFASGAKFYCKLDGIIDNDDSKKPFASITDGNIGFSAASVGSGVDYVINGAVTINTGYSGEFAFKASDTITVNAGKTLTVNKDLAVAGDIILKGTLAVGNSNSLTVGKTLTMETGGVINGTIIDNGIVTIPSYDGLKDSTCTITINAGKSFFVGTTPVFGANAIVAGDNATVTKLGTTGLDITVGNASITKDGTCTIPVGSKLTVSGGKTFAATGKLVIEGSFGVTSTVGITGSYEISGASAKFYIGDVEYIGSGSNIVLTKDSISLTSNSNGGYDATLNGKATIKSGYVLGPTDTLEVLGTATISGTIDVRNAITVVGIVTGGTIDFTKVEKGFIAIDVVQGGKLDTTLKSNTMINEVLTDVTTLFDNVIAGANGFKVVNGAIEEGDVTIPTGSAASVSGSLSGSVTLTVSSGAEVTVPAGSELIIGSGASVVLNDVNSKLTAGADSDIIFKEGSSINNNGVVKIYTKNTKIDSAGREHIEITVTLVSAKAILNIYEIEVFEGYTYDALVNVVMNVRDGYTFNGWYNSTNEQITSSSVVPFGVDDHTLTAKFTYADADSDSFWTDQNVQVIIGCFALTIVLLGLAVVLCRR